MSTRLCVPALLIAALALSLSSCSPATPAASKPTNAAEDVPPETIVHPPKQLPDPTRHRIEEAIKNVKDRDLLATNGFWTIFHGILGLGPSITLRDPLTNARVNAVDYIADGGELRGLRFIPTKHGLDVQMGPLMVGQGHQDQYVAEMAQWGMPADKQFLVFGKEYTFMDFVRHSQMRARTTSNQELSWAILIIGQFYGTEASWTNENGEQLTMEACLRYELNASFEQVACGGTHRLFGLAWVHQLHKLRGGSDGPIWKDIAAATKKYRDLAKEYQNADGSFSTSFFRSRGNSQDPQLQINTTGHTLEWLALALTDAELREPWMQSAANAAAMQILDHSNSPIEGGSLYHAVHGLSLYYARVYGREFLGANTPIFPTDVVKAATAQGLAKRRWRCVIT